MTFTLKSLASQCDPHFVDLLVSGVDWNGEQNVMLTRGRNLTSVMAGGRAGGQQRSRHIIGPR